MIFKFAVAIFQTMFPATAPVVTMFQGFVDIGCAVVASGK
jgi:hypothetical protein